MLDRCPYCGSDEGIYYIVTRRVQRYSGFGEGAEDAEILRQDEPKTGKCINCDKRIKVADVTTYP